MFRDRHRRAQPFSDFINWTDYHWEPTPWHGSAAGPRPWTPHAPHRRGFSLLQIFLAGLAVVLGLKLMSTLRNRGNRSLLERSALALVLLLVASYTSKRGRRL
jgi:hypothetical protein